VRLGGRGRSGLGFGAPFFVYVIMPEATKGNTSCLHINRTSAPLLEGQIGKLCQRFPEAFSESKVDFDKLRATLGDSIETRPERFSFSWAGKQEAIALSQAPSWATLVPRPAKSVNFDATQHAFIEGKPRLLALSESNDGPSQLELEIGGECQ
jgi:hypothetical protein